MLKSEHIIKFHMLNQHWTTAQVAEAVDTTPDYVNQVLHTNNRKAAEPVHRLAMATHIMPGTGPYRLQNVPWKRVADGECL